MKLFKHVKIKQYVLQILNSISKFVVTIIFGLIWINILFYDLVHSGLPFIPPLLYFLFFMWMFLRQNFPLIRAGIRKWASLHTPNKEEGTQKPVMSGEILWLLIRKQWGDELGRWSFKTLSLQAKGWYPASYQLDVRNLHSKCIDC